MTLAEFQFDLSHGMTINDALIKHNLTLGEAFNQLHKENYKKRKPPARDPSLKYITRNKADGKYYIRKSKSKNGSNKTLRFGTYATLSDAKRMRDALMENGWQQKSVNQLCKELGVTRCDTRSRIRYS